MMPRIKKFIFPVVLILALAGFGWWLLTPSDLLGEAVPIQGREHLKTGEAPPIYNSNPPTSGPHDATPAQPGFYEATLPDRNLVHSLEHGYVVISYNCQIKDQRSKIRDTDRRSKMNSLGEVFAHGEEASPSVQASSSASKADASDETCRKLKDSLRKIFDNYKGWKIIVEPRENLETRLALTAWGHLYKFNPSTGSTSLTTGSLRTGPSGSNGLGQADIKKIEKFIDNFRDKAPEQTPD